MPTPTADEIKALLAAGKTPADILKYYGVTDSTAIAKATAAMTPAPAPTSTPAMRGEQRNLMAESLKGNAAEALPFLLGAAATMFAPEIGPLGGAVARPIAAAAGGFGGKLGAQAIQGQPLNIPSAIGAGAVQAGLQGVAELPGAIGGALQYNRDTMRARAVNQALTQSRALRNAANITPELQALAKQTAQEGFNIGKASKQDLATSLAQMSKQAQTARSQAGAAVQAELASSPGQVTRKEIVDKVVTAINPATPEATRTLRRVVMGRITEGIASNDVLAAKLGNPRKLVFSAPEVNQLKRYWGQLSKGGMTQAAKGILPRPDLDPYIGAALKDLEVSATPTVAPLNAASQQALLKARAFQTAEQALPHPELTAAKQGVAEQALLSKADLRAQAAAERLRLRNEAADRVVAQRVLAARTANPLAIYRAIPAHGQFALPGVTIKSGMVSELLGKGGEALSSPFTTWPAFWLPRLAAYLATKEQK